MLVDSIKFKGHRCFKNDWAGFDAIKPITEAKEIENYLPGGVIGKVFGIESVPDPGQYEAFFPSDSVERKGSSFTESKLKRKSVDKMDLAVQSAPHITKALMESRFDLTEQVLQIIDRIRAWNS